MEQKREHDRTRQNTTENLEQIDVIKDRLKCSAMGRRSRLLVKFFFGGRHEFSVRDAIGWYEGGAVQVWVVGQTSCGSFEFWPSPRRLSRFFVLIANAVHYKK